MPRQTNAVADAEVAYVGRESTEEAPADVLARIRDNNATDLGTLAALLLDSGQFGDVTQEPVEDVNVVPVDRDATDGLVGGEGWDGGAASEPGNTVDGAYRAFDPVIGQPNATVPEDLASGGARAVPMPEVPEARIMPMPEEGTETAGADGAVYVFRDGGWHARDGAPRDGG